ncbi:unnamed protein product, partial [Heterosigma akashiwo]
DWARGTSPRGAGTLSAAAGLLVDALAAGEGATARKIAFGQMLLSGQADGGEGWGRGAGVIVRERNRAAAAEVARAARELAPQGGGSCAVLYGGLHMQVAEPPPPPHRRPALAGWWEGLGRPRPPPARSQWAGRPAGSTPNHRTLRAGGEGGVKKGRGHSRFCHQGSNKNGQHLQWLCNINVTYLRYLLQSLLFWTSRLPDLARRLTKGLRGVHEFGRWCFVFRAGLYLLRHAYLYYGLARYLVRWDRRLFQQQQ